MVILYIYFEIRETKLYKVEQTERKKHLYTCARIISRIELQKHLGYCKFSTLLMLFHFYDVMSLTNFKKCNLQTQQNNI